MNPQHLQLAAIIVEQGKILDFIDGNTQRRETPEEYVRQEIPKSLVREYRYSKADVEVEFIVRVGTRKPRADLVVFPPSAPHVQENAEIIVECKAPTVKAADKKDGVAQLHSYMAVCPNVRYGMWTNGIERFCFRRVIKSGKVAVEDVPDISEFGRTDDEAERPRFDQLKPATSDALLFAFRTIDSVPLISGGKELHLIVVGRAYEEIVGSNLRGDRGEFFTPRNICRMAVTMLDPSEKEMILDPACGTGGFLITAMNHVIERIRAVEMAKWGNKVERAEKAIRERVKKFAEHSIVGIDFNPELVKASKMNMVMNNDGAGGLFQANSLEAPATWDPDLRKYNIVGRVDRLFTNPPFGSKILVTDPAILEQYDLGHSWTYDKSADRWLKNNGVQKAQPPEILFIERCVRLLRPGTGRLAIVLPDGILGSPGLGYVREWILRNTRVLARIDLHPDTFQPFVSIQTSVLVLQRKTDGFDRSRERSRKD